MRKIFTFAAKIIPMPLHRKKHYDQRRWYGWLFLCNGNEDMLVAYSDDGTLWGIDATDAILRNPHYANGFKEYPTIDWDSAEQLGVYY